MQKMRDWIATVLVTTGLRIGGSMFAQLMIIVLVTRLMRNQNMAAIELVGSGVVIHKHPEDAEDMQPTTLH